MSRKLLLRKLYDKGVRGKVFNVIKDMYRTDQTCIRIADKWTDFFEVSQGVKQGCILSPCLFNMFLSDLPSIFNQVENRPAKLDDTVIGSLLWADDLVIISEGREGLQHSLDKLEHYCQINKLKVNVNKTKCMVFNKGGRTMHSNKLYFGKEEQETVRKFNYLGSLITPSLSIKELLSDLYERGLKAYFKMKNCLRETFKQHIQVTLKHFDSLVKPILLYRVSQKKVPTFHGTQRKTFGT